MSRYLFHSKLGAGGMGEVYLAEDASLKRKVALKFLPASLLADDRARKRLIQEAHAARAGEGPGLRAGDGQAGMRAGKVVAISRAEQVRIYRE
jgi:serine/threonine protein kinase